MNQIQNPVDDEPRKQAKKRCLRYVIEVLNVLGKLR